MRIITVEEHTISPALNKALAKYGRGGAPYQEMAHAKGYPYDADPVLFADMGEKRIADMDAAGIAMQVVSCPVQPQQLPPEIAISAVREANDELADAIRKHPDRFAGFCALPWPDSEAAEKSWNARQSWGIAVCSSAVVRSSKAVFWTIRALRPFWKLPKHWKCRSMSTPVHQWMRCRRLIMPGWMIWSVHGCRCLAGAGIMRRAFRSCA